MDAKLAQLQKELEELKVMESQATQTRVRNLLTVEIHKIVEDINSIQNQMVGNKTAIADSKVAPVKSRPHVKLYNYAWSQTIDQVEIRVKVPQLKKTEKDQISCTFTEKAVQFEATDIDGKDYMFSLKGLLDSIDADGSTLKVISGTVIMLAKKQNNRNWDYITDADKKTHEAKIKKNDNLKDNNADPSESLMSMLKNMYETGDDDMKRTIAKAWCESREKSMLQYRSVPTERFPVGFYVYDLGSTHGTYLNKKQVHSHYYTRIQVGHILKLGTSTRAYILTGPSADEEAESSLSITEMKRVAEEKQLEKLKVNDKTQKKMEKMEERGIDWGLGGFDVNDSDDNEVDSTDVNPYSVTNNEHLFLDDPKKTLRGFFEREGLDLQYDCQEQGMGQFRCRIELPIDDERGRPIVAEVLLRGKKREIVVQCALEACRILDRYGVLRQATHESRKRVKRHNWEENDYYDSDEDTFLDRTGTVERKREQRMRSTKSKQHQIDKSDSLSYEELVNQQSELRKSIEATESKLQKLQQKSSADGKNAAADVDSLDVYMQAIQNENFADKVTISKLKADLNSKRHELSQIEKMVKLVAPSISANLPPLIKKDDVKERSSSGLMTVYGKRRKVPVRKPETVTSDHQQQLNDSDDFAEVAECNSGGDKNDVVEEEVKEMEATLTKETDNEAEGNDAAVAGTSSQDTSQISPAAGVLVKHKSSLSVLMAKLKDIVWEGDSMDVDWKAIEAKKRKLIKLISDLHTSENTEKLQYQVSIELTRLMDELNQMHTKSTKVIRKVQGMGDRLATLTHQIQTDVRQLHEQQEGGTENSTSSPLLQEISEQLEKLTRGRQRRRRCTAGGRDLAHSSSAHSRSIATNEAEEDDIFGDMWLPPTGQSGDGRTALNDRYGY